MMTNEWEVKATSFNATSASLLGAGTLLGAPGRTTRSKKLLVTSASLLVAFCRWTGNQSNKSEELDRRDRWNNPSDSWDGGRPKRSSQNLKDKF